MNNHSKGQQNLYVMDANDYETGSEKNCSTGGGEPPLISDGEHTVFLCKEFLNEYPKDYLLRITAWWVFVLVLACCVDVATMKHIISGKFSDAFGNATASEGVIWVAAALTLMVFLLISFLWKKGDKK